MIHDPVLVRNPGGLEVWVAGERLPELLKRGFEVVKPSQGKGEAPPKPTGRRKGKKGTAK